MLEQRLFKRVIFGVLVLLAGCANEYTVNSYVSIHRNVSLTTNAGVTSLPDFVENETAISDVGLILQPSILGKILKIHFYTLPVDSHIVTYQSEDNSGHQYVFKIYEGSPIEETQLTQYSATLELIEPSLNNEAAQSYIPSGDQLSGKTAYRYQIKWEENELRADVEIIQSSHVESDPLLN